MRKSLTGVLSLAVLIGTVGATGASAGAATAAELTVERSSGAAAGSEASNEDIKDRILAIPGMSLVQEKPYAGYRYFVLNYTQPVDHRRPSKGTFQQRLTLLHKDVSRPTVFFTSGYNVSTNPSRSEPTQIIDGNQVSLEYRYFTPSRPAPADWSKLDIWQAASDQHRVFTALKKIYDKKWLATGGSKGGMTATYFERFYPKDMDGVVAYVAPNDVNDKEDSAYDRFFANVGTEECRDKLAGVQREALIRRAPLQKKYKELAEANGWTFNTVGSLDRAYEATVMDYTFAFWQYSLLADCVDIPADAKKATDEDIWNSVDAIAGLLRLHRPGPGDVHPVLLPGGHPARVAGHQAALARQPEPLRLPAPAQLRAPLHPDEVRPGRDAGRRPLGQAQRPADDVRQRRERPVERGAVPSRTRREGQLRLHRPRRQPRLEGLRSRRMTRRRRPPPRSCAGQASPRRPSRRTRPRRSRWRSSTPGWTSATVRSSATRPRCARSGHAVLLAAVPGGPRPPVTLQVTGGRSPPACPRPGRRTGPWCRGTAPAAAPPTPPGSAGHGRPRPHTRSP